MSEKDDLTKYRLHHLKHFYPSTADRIKVTALERKYGKYLYLPFDVPRIEAHDKLKFITWYREHATPVTKIKHDVAGGVYSGRKNFLSINSPNQKDSIWEQNLRDDLFTTFPEILEQLKALPFSIDDAEWAMWSSCRQVALHRDQCAWEDFPASFRVMLYDNNPGATLFIRERTAGIVTNNFPMLKLHRAETNAFGWNNLRTAHGSAWDPAYTKVLMIFTSVKFDLDKLEDLFERSIAKYGHEAYISTSPFNSFVHF